MYFNKLRVDDDKIAQLTIIKNKLQNIKSQLKIYEDDRDKVLELLRDRNELRKQEQEIFIEIGKTIFEQVLTIK